MAPVSIQQQQALLDLDELEALFECEDCFAHSAPPKAYSVEPVAVFAYEHCMTQQQQQQIQHSVHAAAHHNDDSEAEEQESMDLLADWRDSVTEPGPLSRPPATASASQRTLPTLQPESDSSSDEDECEESEDLLAGVRVEEDSAGAALPRVLSVLTAVSAAAPAEHAVQQAVEDAVEQVVERAAEAVTTPAAAAAAAAVVTAPRPAQAQAAAAPCATPYKSRKHAEARSGSSFSSALEYGDELEGDSDSERTSQKQPAACLSQQHSCERDAGAQSAAAAAAVEHADPTAAAAAAVHDTRDARPSITAASSLEPQHAA
eukprot:18578-Heterococcus_DN1.PRE.1